MLELCILIQPCRPASEYQPTSKHVTKLFLCNQESRVSPQTMPHPYSSKPVKCVQLLRTNIRCQEYVIRPCQAHKVKMPILETKFRPFLQEMLQMDLSLRLGLCRVWQEMYDRATRDSIRCKAHEGSHPPCKMKSQNSAKCDPVAIETQTKSYPPSRVTSAAAMEHGGTL